MQEYIVFDEVGRTEKSVVYRARKKFNIEYVAAKSILKEYTDDIRKEARYLHSFQHPNILRFFSWYETEEHIWLVVELCTGGSLEKLLEEDGCLPVESTRLFARDIREALHFCHRKGTIYGPLESRSVLLDGNGNLKLYHFNNAIQVDDVQVRSQQQFEADAKDHVRLLPPELLDREGVPSYETDLWAMGILLYYMAFGRHPFITVSDTPLQAARNTLTCPLDIPAGTDADFKSLLTGLLSRDPRERLAWPALAIHPFFGEPLKLGALPPEPMYQRYRGIAQKFDESDSHAVQHRLSKIAAILSNRKSGSGILPPETPTTETETRMFMSAIPEDDFQAPPDAEPLLRVAEDLKARPIVLTKQIDRYAKISYDHLAADAPTAAELARMSAGDLEAWTGRVITMLDIRDLSDSHKPVLALVLHLLKSVEVASALISSPLPSHLARLLRAHRDPSTRSLVCCVLSLLFRAEARTSSSAHSEVGFALLEALQTATTKNLQGLRRMATAALAEVLFYLGSRTDRQSIPPSMIPTFLDRVDDLDVVVSHYICRAIENIAVWTPHAATATFFTPAVIVAMGRFISTPGDSTAETNRRVAALSAVGRHGLNNPALIHAAAEKLHVLPISGLLAENNPRVQLAALNILNAVFSTGSPPKRIVNLLAGDKVLADSVLKLTEHSHALFRGKALVACGQMIRGMPATSIEPLLTKRACAIYGIAMFDSAVYVGHCAVFLAAQIQLLAEQTFSKILSEIRNDHKMVTINQKIEKARLLSPAFDRADLRPHLSCDSMLQVLAVVLPLSIQVLPNTNTPIISDDALDMVKSLCVAVTAQVTTFDMALAVGQFLPALVFSLCQDPIPATRYHYASCLLMALNTVIADGGNMPVVVKFVKEHMLTVFRPLLYDHSPIPKIGTHLLARCIALDGSVLDELAQHSRLVFTDLLGFCHATHPHLHSDVVLILRIALANRDIRRELLQTREICRLLAALMVDVLKATETDPDPNEARNVSVLEEILAFFSAVLDGVGDNGLRQRSQCILTGQTQILDAFTPLVACLANPSLQLHALHTIALLVRLFGPAHPGTFLDETLMHAMAAALQGVASADRVAMIQWSVATCRALVAATAGTPAPEALVELLRQLDSLHEGDGDNVAASLLRIVAQG
ncbi:Protein kinase domain [Carpediemonas membranifera]|uniref:Protein kinase domain n=1 Tax=Carpediemonas membranifera TaxID=201153 RepID=A0A8J6ASK5_9EUKA|nr:Protein kinase domain [Carpediemonas membranifera]|eukprot:KAG9393013.1 Protein kinase domain [Carpediemonas membranifera]